MRFVRRLVRLVFCHVGAAALLTGCGGSPSPDAKTAAPTSPSVVAPHSDPLTPDPAIQDLTLPVAKSAALAAPPSLRVYVTRSALLVGSPATSVASVPPDAEAQKRGFDLSVKRSGPNDLFLVPLAARVSGMPAARSALVFVDRGTPYRMVVEVLFTLGQSEITEYDLVTKNTDGTLGAIHVVPPRALTAANAAELLSPMLSVLVVDGGFSIKARGGNVAPGCNDVGPGLAIPASAANGTPAHDLPALAGCLAKLKAEVPGLAASDAVVVTANPGTRAELVLQAVAAAAAGPDGRPLFPRPMFGISR